jgi:hypothetical protein
VGVFFNDSGPVPRWRRSFKRPPHTDKQCALCGKAVTKADYDDANAEYTNVLGSLCWHHLNAKSGSGCRIVKVIDVRNLGARANLRRFMFNHGLTAPIERLTVP